jgi:hypothetical protein
MPKRTQLTEAEREQRRAADREFVQPAVEQLRSSQGWQRWLTTRRRAGVPVAGECASAPAHFARPFHGSRSEQMVVPRLLGIADSPRGPL